MSNVEAYEGNLEARLQELKQGEQAYKLHYIVVAEAACTRMGATIQQVP